MFIHILKEIDIDSLKEAIHKHDEEIAKILEEIENLKKN